MRYKDRARSGNVEDRRGVTPGRAAGVGGVGIVIAVILFLVTGDPSALLGGL